MQTDFTKDEDHQAGGDEDVPQPARLEEDETMAAEMAATAPVSGDNKEGIASAAAAATRGHDKDDNGDISGKVGHYIEIRAEPESSVVQIMLLLLISFRKEYFRQLSASHRCH